jgi:uncharacterized membrane protein
MSTNRRKNKNDTEELSKDTSRSISKRKLFLVLPIAGLVCVGLFILMGVLLIDTKGVHSPAVASATEVTYPVEQFADGKARHFEYRLNDGIRIRYFILKSSDGVIRAAFDACDVCWPANKGYYQEGDKMVCRNCGKRFASIKVNEVKGGCNPAPLNRKVLGENLVIQVKELLEGKKYFDFTKRG